jgi:diguanylate cyclase (GGDEF)-like protein
LRTLSRVDGLSGLGNDRAYAETLRRETMRAAESGQPISLVVVDIDFFESFEALYDRKAADACIASVAEAVRRSARRPGDFVARLDRDRFALVLPDTTADNGLHLANRALRAVESLDISHQGSAVSRHVTASAGVSFIDAWDGVADGHDALDFAARTALDQAKRAGRAQAHRMPAGVAAATTAAADDSSDASSSGEPA